MLNAILSWLAGWILDYLLGQFKSQLNKSIEQGQTDMQRGIANDANLKAYQDAVDRLERQKAALDLINGVMPNPEDAVKQAIGETPGKDQNAT